MQHVLALQIVRKGGYNTAVMKILFILECANCLTNGTSATCLRFAEELRKKGHECKVLGCYFENQQDPAWYVGFDHFKFPIFEALIHKEGFNFVKVDPAKIYEEVKTADVVHLFLPFKFSNVARLIAQYIGVPVTAAFHMQPQNVTSAIHMGQVGFVNDVLYGSFRRYLYRHVKHIHCPSQMIADQLISHKYSMCVPHVISNGINEYFHPIEAERPKELEGKYIVTMSGRLAREKRQDLIIRAIAESPYNEKIQLILCGQGPEKDRYLALAKKVKLANMPIIGFQSQESLRNILNYTDLYVHASDFEIEGISCIEAFACGAVPVVSDSKLSATRSFALDPQCIFKHGQYKSLKHRINYFIEHPERKEELSKQYIELAPKYALPIMVDRFEEMLKEAIEDKKNGQDLPTLRPSKTDRIKAKKIFRALKRNGIIEEIPENLR